MEHVCGMLGSEQTSNRGDILEMPSPSGRLRPNRRSRSILMLLGMLTLTSCFDQVLVPDVDTDGRLTVTSKVKHGSSFTVWLPKAHA